MMLNFFLLELPAVGGFPGELIISSNVSVGHVLDHSEGVAAHALHMVLTSQQSFSDMLVGICVGEAVQACFLIGNARAQQGFEVIRVLGHRFLVGVLIEIFQGLVQLI
uniref:Uncharacterized protein n=1 Tax=Rhizophora mucronata TaxID=61149 RepID=A0A2P2QQG9_RHIMU